MSDHYPDQRPRQPADMSAEQDELIVGAWRQTAALSGFTPLPADEPFLGFGPEGGQVYLSHFHQYDGIDDTYGGVFPIEEQPTLPDVPPHLRGPRV